MLESRSPWPSHILISSLMQSFEKATAYTPSMVFTTQPIIPVQHKIQVMEGCPQFNAYVDNWHQEIQSLGTEYLCTVKKLPWYKQKKTKKETETAVWPKSSLKYGQTKHLEDRYRAWFGLYLVLLILKNNNKAFHSPVDRYLYIYTHTQRTE